jgi:tetratricopeptide (TPR) repeat protein
VRIWDATPLEQKPIEWEPGQRAAEGNEQGTTYVRRGQWGEAVRVWEKLVADYPDRLEFRVQLAGGYQKLAGMLATSTDPKVRDPGQAVALAKRAVALAPKEGTYWHTLGEAQYRAGHWKAAIEALTQSMELRDGSNSYDWFLLAMAYGQLGDKTQAITWFDKAEQWWRKNRPPTEEVLLRLHAEAAALLDVKEKKN